MKDGVSYDAAWFEKRVREWVAENAVIPCSVTASTVLLSPFETLIAPFQGRNGMIRKTAKLEDEKHVRLYRDTCVHLTAALWHEIRAMYKNDPARMNGISTAINEALPEVIECMVHGQIVPRKHRHFLAPLRQHKASIVAGGRGTNQRPEKLRHALSKLVAVLALAEKFGILSFRSIMRTNFRHGLPSTKRNGRSRARYAFLCRENT